MVVPTVSYKGVCIVDHTSMSDTADSFRLPSVSCKTANTADHTCDTMTCNNKYTAFLGSGPQVTTDSSSNCATVGEGDSEPLKGSLDLDSQLYGTENDTSHSNQFWEIEQSTDHQIVDVQGRLKKKLSFWKDILKAPMPILDCLSEGYKLPLLSPTPPFTAKNRKSALENAEFVSSAINEIDMCTESCM